jgi:hypothetical protein
MLNISRIAVSYAATRVKVWVAENPTLRKNIGASI